MKKKLFINHGYPSRFATDGSNLGNRAESEQIGTVIAIVVLVIGLIVGMAIGWFMKPVETVEVPGPTVTITMITTFTIMPNPTPPNTPSSIKTTISEILADPSTWENEIVEVVGIIDGVVTIPTVRLPFNYWIFDESNKTKRIGVLWNGKEPLMIGEPARLSGVFKSGYEQCLSCGWVNTTLVYYIEAQAVN